LRKRYVSFVIPAYAGIQDWTPAKAGVTEAH
jgi:hypothetical protein